MVTLMVLSWSTLMGKPPQTWSTLLCELAQTGSPEILPFASDRVQTIWCRQGAPNKASV